MGWHDPSQFFYIWGARVAALAIRTAVEAVPGIKILYSD